MEENTKYDVVQEPEAVFGNALYINVQTANVYSLIETIKSGFTYKAFRAFIGSIPFTLQEWADFLHVSGRTLHRYEQNNSTFDAPQSERILEIGMLYKQGLDVFGNPNKFNAWLNAPSVSLGGRVPKSLLDSTLGIQLLKDELIRIQHGVLS